MAWKWSTGCQNLFDLCGPDANLTTTNSFYKYYVFSSIRNKSSGLLNVPCQYLRPLLPNRNSKIDLKGHAPTQSTKLQY